MGDIAQFLRDIDFIAPNGGEQSDFAQTESDRLSAVIAVPDNGMPSWDLTNTDPAVPEPTSYSDYYTFNDPGSRTVGQVVTSEPGRVNQGFINVPTESIEYEKKEDPRAVTPIKSGDASVFQRKAEYPSEAGGSSDFFNMWKLADAQVLDMPTPQAPRDIFPAPSEIIQDNLGAY